MLTEEQINRIAEDYILKKEKLGFQGSTSGHMAHVSYRIDNVSGHMLVDGTTEISCSYTLLVETEFTFYPDNPPYETPCTIKIIVARSTGEETA